MTSWQRSIVTFYLRCMVPRWRGFIASRIWRHRDFSARGRFTPFYTTDSERATMTSWQRSIVTFYLQCMVSEITQFNCQPDLTSSSVFRHWAQNANFHDWFWKSDHDFLIAFHSKFLSAMHGFRDNEVLLSTGCDVIVISPPGGATRSFLICDSERATQTTCSAVRKSLSLFQNPSCKIA